MQVIACSLRMPCACRYTKEGMRGLICLKGADRAVGNALALLAQSADVDVHLGIYYVGEAGWGQGGPWGKKMEDIQESNEDLQGVISLGGDRMIGTMSVEDEDVFLQACAWLIMHICKRALYCKQYYSFFCHVQDVAGKWQHEIEEATGNEGATIYR